jgi:hypothetical protein
MKTLITIFLSGLLFFSCKKETETAICFTGKIHWGGSQAVDGLEWQIYDNVNNVFYKVIDPGFAYQQNNLTVQVCLTKTNETYPCFCAGPVYIYNIKSISR